MTAQPVVADENTNTADGGSGKDKTKRKPAFTFTDAGCRWEVRLGVLLLLAASFLWAWLGPLQAKNLLFIGVPLLAIGVPLQAWQARRGRPGYPLKLGLILVVVGLVMCYDLAYRERVGQGISVPPPPLIIIVAGAWMLALYPLARFGVGKRETADGA